MLSHPENHFLFPEVWPQCPRDLAAVPPRFKPRDLPAETPRAARRDQLQEFRTFLSKNIWTTMGEVQQLIPFPT